MNPERSNGNNIERSAGQKPASQNESYKSRELTPEEAEVRKAVSKTTREIKTIFQKDQMQAIGEAVWGSGLERRKNPKHDKPLMKVLSTREEPGDEIEDREQWDRTRFVEYLLDKFGKKQLIRKALDITGKEMHEKLKQLKTVESQHGTAINKSKKQELQTKFVEQNDKIRMAIHLLEARFQNLLPEERVENELDKLRQKLKAMKLTNREIEIKINNVRLAAELDHHVVSRDDLPK